MSSRPLLVVATSTPKLRLVPPLEEDDPLDVPPLEVEVLVDEVARHPTIMARAEGTRIALVPLLPIPIRLLLIKR